MCSKASNKLSAHTLLVEGQHLLTPDLAHPVGYAPVMTPNPPHVPLAAFEISDDLEAGTRLAEAALHAMDLQRQHLEMHLADAVALVVALLVGKVLEAGLDLGRAQRGQWTRTLEWG